MQIIDRKLSNTGVIISVGCGVITLQGFFLAYVGELFRICCYNATQVSLGVVVNLYRNLTLTLIIGALLILIVFQKVLKLLVNALYFQLL